MKLDLRAIKNFVTPAPRQKRKRIIDRLAALALVSGIACFGFIFVDSTSDHEKILHFSAHFGMSFLISLFIYALCSMKLGINAKRSFAVFIISTFVIGCIYKYWEIFSQALPDLGFAKILEITGFYTSMSQNIAGILAAIYIVKYFFNPVLILTLPGNLILRKDFSSPKDMA